jgi:cation:H+ antiporter
MNAYLMLIVGLVVLLTGGEALVRGATSLARSFGVSPMVVGLTVVAFGTSAPELAVNAMAAIRGENAITFGNVVGSNIANIGLIVGITALVTPQVVHKSIVTRELPIMLLATALALVLFRDRLWGASSEAITRIDGVILLVGFVAFLVITVRTAVKARHDPFMEEAEENRPRSVGRGSALLLTIIGLAGVLIGSEWTVSGATKVATALGMSQAVIGLTIVAIGTSLPELTTSLFAAAKGHADLAMGNIVGSNVFNLLFVLGVSTSIRELALPEGGVTDLWVMVALSVILLPFAARQRRLGRAEGAFLLVSYIAYMSWRTFG